MTRVLLHTLESFSKKMEKVGKSTFEPLEYNGSSMKLVARCKVCGYLYMSVTADYLLSKKYCNECRRIDILEKEEILTRKLKDFPTLPKVRKHDMKTYQEVIDKRSYLDITLLTFTTSKGESRYRMNCCGSEFSIKSAANLLKLRHCRVCSPQYYENTVEDVERMCEYYNLSIVGKSDYVPKYRDMVTVRYKCGCEKKVQYGSITSGKNLWCVPCEGRVKNLIHDVDAANSRLRNNPYSNYKIIGEYGGTEKKCKMQCMECKTISYDRVSDVLKRISGCLVCGRKGSFKERLLRMTLTDLGVKFSSEVSFDWLKTDTGKMFYDVYIEEYKVAIEYDGGFHRMEDVKRRDELKDRLSKENGVTVYRIGENESVVKKVIEIIGCVTTIP